MQEKIKQVSRTDRHRLGQDNEGEELDKFVEHDRFLLGSILARVAVLTGYKLVLTGYKPDLTGYRVALVGV
jgi:hypothetical protein